MDDIDAIIEVSAIEIHASFSAQIIIRLNLLLKKPLMIKSLENIKNIQVLSNNYIGHLAFISKEWPHVVPITYYYNVVDNCIIGYSGEGHKINAMRKNSSVSMEVTEIDTVNKWKSVLALGTYEELHGIDAKYKLHEFALGVKKIMAEKENKQAQFINEFSSKINSQAQAIVFQIRVLEVSGKTRNY